MALISGIWFWACLILDPLSLFCSILYRREAVFPGLPDQLASCLVWHIQGGPGEGFGGGGWEEEAEYGSSFFACVGCPARLAASLTHSPTAQTHRLRLQLAALAQEDTLLALISASPLRPPLRLGPSISWRTISLNYFLSCKQLKGILLSSLDPNWYTDQVVGPRGPSGGLWSWAEVSRPPVGYKPPSDQTRNALEKKHAFLFPRFITMRLG